MSRVPITGRDTEGRIHPDADGKREKWEVSGPHFAGWEMYHLKGFAGGPESPLRLADQRLVRATDPALRRRRQDVGTGRKRVSSTTAHPGTHQWYDGTPASVGVQARLASRTVADRSRHGLCRRGRRGAFQSTRTAARRWQELPGLRSAQGQSLAARRRRHVPAYDPARSEPIRTASSSPSRPRARSAPTTAARPGSRSIAA